MYPRLHFTKFVTISLALHALMIVTLLFLARHDVPDAPFSIPVDIVNLPPETLKKLPPVEQKIPKIHTGRSDVLRLPRTEPGAELEGKGHGAKTVPEKVMPDGKMGMPLPFLSQKDIDALARKGYHDKLKNDPLSEETEAFKFLPYGRSLIGRLDKNLRFPELAVISGMQGDVFIVFEIWKDGSLGSITVTKSSGYKILDDEVIRDIQDSAPFQPLPPEWDMERLVVPVVGIFRVNYKDLR